VTTFVLVRLGDAARFTAVFVAGAAFFAGDFFAIA
jgi:hypothetical protein